MRDPRNIPDFRMPPPQPKSTPRELPFQKSTERLMKELVQVGSYEAIYLFNAEGLPMAKHVAKDDMLSERHAVEFAVLTGKLQKVVRRMSGLGPLRELMMEDETGKKLVFRFIQVFRQPAVLVLVIPAHRTYRGLANRLGLLIRKLSEE
jgi:predicted regulator of Ras-like GTPase activity (Roadblock/LC7/MglB family)